MHRDIDIIIAKVQSLLPTVRVEQFRVVHPGDDDCLWFFKIPNVEQELQIEARDGNCPFLIETDLQSSSEALRAATIDDAVNLITQYFQGALHGHTVNLKGDKFWEQGWV